MPSEQSPWVVKGVPEYIRRKVKIYAVQRGITMAQAVEEIINAVIPGEAWEVLGNPMGRPSFSPPTEASASNVQVEPPPLTVVPVDTRTWLKAWLNGSPIPWLHPELYETNRRDMDHKFIRSIMSGLDHRDIPEYLMMWVDQHLHSCEECQQFARDLLRE